VADPGRDEKYAAPSCPWHVLAKLVVKGIGTIQQDNEVRDDAKLHHALVFVVAAKEEKRLLLEGECRIVETYLSQELQVLVERGASPYHDGSLVMAEPPASVFDGATMGKYLGRVQSQVFFPILHEMTASLLIRFLGPIPKLFPIVFPDFRSMSQELVVSRFTHCGTDPLA
jgi:hypothetical protein